jgi:hypothetical protein
LSSLLKDNTVITTLGVANCEMTNDGLLLLLAVVVILCKQDYVFYFINWLDLGILCSALSYNKTLLRLDIRGNDKLRLKGIIALKNLLASSSSILPMSGDSGSKMHEASSALTSCVPSQCILQYVALDQATLVYY